MTPLEAICQTVRHNHKEDGIYLVSRFRYEASARRLAALVKEAGGYVESVAKAGKTVYRDHAATKTWTVTFSVGTDEDLFLTGRINVYTLKAFLANRRKRAAAS